MRAHNTWRFEEVLWLCPEPARRKRVMSDADEYRRAHPANNEDAALGHVLGHAVTGKALATMS
jgi:hypothetical protein